MVFDSESNHAYLFIVNNQAEKFEGQIECLEENTEKYITFVSIKENGNDRQWHAK